MGLIKSINKALANKSSTAFEVSDSEQDDTMEKSIQRDFLYLLTLSHQKFVKEYDNEVRSRLAEGQCLNDSVVNLYLERILQPIADTTYQNVAFVPSEFYGYLQGPPDHIDDRALNILNRYELSEVRKFVTVCNAPGHWYTLTIEYHPTVPTITIMDSMSTSDPSDEDYIIQKILNIFSTFYKVEPNKWEKVIPLKTVLQHDGVNCGIWALIFAESCLKEFKSIESLKDVNISVERQRITKEIEMLLDWKNYHYSYLCEGDIYRRRNPESERFQPIRAKLQSGNQFALLRISI